MSVLDHLRHPGWPRRALFGLGLLLALTVIIRLVLDPIAAHFTHKQLNASEAVSGDFESVHVTLLPPGYGIRRLKIIEAQGGDWRHPLFYAEHARVTLDWRRLLHAELAARLRLDGPKMVMTATGGKLKIPDIGAALEKVIPARVDRVEVREGEFLYRDVTAPRHPEFWLHDIELAAENLTTRKRLAGGRPATVSARATLGKSGTVTFFASADLFAAKPEFAGQLALRGWRVAELYDLEQPATKLQTPKGSLDLFAEFKARDGAISGGVKPVLRNVEVRPTEDGFGNKPRRGSPTRASACSRTTSRGATRPRPSSRSKVASISPTSRSGRPSWVSYATPSSKGSPRGSLIFRPRRPHRKRAC